MRDCRLDGVRLTPPLTGLSLPYADAVGAAGTLAVALGLELVER